MSKFIVNFNEGTSPTLKTKLIGYFSIDSESNYRADLSQLKYLIRPSNLDDVNFDLNVNFESTRHISTSHIKLDYILKWISDHFHQIERPLSTQEERLLDIEFVCPRGVLKTLLKSPYEKYNEWIICASKYRGTIYLCEFYTDDREHHHVNSTSMEKKNNSLGIKFEQYMVADQPSKEPDPSKSLNECEQFHCMFQATFDNHSLLYKAEIDCIFSEQPIKDILINKSFEFIELKTVPEKGLNGNELKIIPFKVINWWSQSYLVEINKITCGFKNETNEVKRIKEYNISDLLKPSCDINMCKRFCKIFLDKVKTIVTKDHDECIYKFYWKPSANDTVNYNEEASDNKKYFFLKQSFVNKVEDYRSTPRAKKLKKN